MEQNVIFVVPRVHPNMLGLLEGFISLNFKITLICIDSTEYIMRGNNKVRIINAQSLSFLKTFTFLRDCRPRLVILRSSNKYSRRVGRICLLLCIKTLIYEQTNVYRQITTYEFVRDCYQVVKRALFFFHVKVISPIKFQNYSKVRKSFLKYYFLFPISLNLGINSVEKEELFSIVIVGKLNQSRKQLLDGLLAVKASKVQARLYIIGSLSDKLVDVDNSYESLMEEVARETSNLKIQILPNLSHEESLSIISKSHILFLTSRDEPFSVSPLEAMALGAVPVVPDTNGSTFLIRDGVDGFVYPESSWSSAARILNTLFIDRKRLHSMSHEALLRVRNEFDPQKSVKAILDCHDLSVMHLLRDNLSPNS